MFISQKYKQLTADYRYPPKYTVLKINIPRQDKVDNNSEQRDIVIIGTQTISKKQVQW